MTPVFQEQNWPVDRLKPYEKNPRINENAVEIVAKSIDEFGFTNPILVNESGTIIAGHTRWKAAIRLGLDQVPVRIVTGLTPEQEKAFRIMDNRSGEKSEWDMDLLPLELSELDLAGFDIELTGFDQLEFEKMTLDLETIAEATGGQGKEPVVQYQIIFNDEDEQQVWNSYLQWLRDKYPDAETISERIVADILKRKILGGPKT